MVSSRKPLSSSVPAHPAGAEPRGRTKGAERLRLVMVLKPGEGPERQQLLERSRRNESARPHQRKDLTTEEVARLHGPASNHLEAVQRFAAEHRLEVVAASDLRHDVVLEGSAEDVERAFGLELEQFESAHGEYRSHRDPILLPDELHEAVEGILGLSTVPHQRPHAESAAVAGSRGRLRWPRQIAEMYGLRPADRGKGQSLAVISLDGGYHPEDLEKALLRQDLPVPQIRQVAVLGCRMQPLPIARLRPIVEELNAPGATFESLAAKAGERELVRATSTVETTMDVEILAALANEASLSLYSAPNNPVGLYTALYAALGQADPGSVETVAGGSKADLPCAISISWGGIECHWSVAEMQPIHRALEAARRLGVTVCCSSGDRGAVGTTLDRAGGLANVNFPAASPCALACGGTALREDGRQGPSERVWNSVRLGTRGATGGGLSGFFPRPEYQKRALESFGPDPAGTWRGAAAEKGGWLGRGVPDVAANADPDTGYLLVVGGVESAGGGTSAATPLWAGLLACLGGRLGRRVGWINRRLYDRDSGPGLRSVAKGDNDITGGKVLAYEAGPGWNPCTGLGTPDFEALLRALQEEG